MVTQGSWMVFLIYIILTVYCIKGNGDTTKSRKSGRPTNGRHLCNRSSIDTHTCYDESRRILYHCEVLPLKHNMGLVCPCLGTRTGRWVRIPTTVGERR